MLEKSENTTLDPLTSSVGDSLVKTSQRSTTNARGLTANDQGYGPNTIESFANFDRDSWSLKTSQACLWTDSTVCSLTFPGGGNI